MNTPGIEFGRKTSAAYAALCKPLCQKLHLPQTAFDILMFLANNPGYQTASDVVEVRKLKANLVSVNVDRLVQEGYLVREADPDDHRKSLPHHRAGPGLAGGIWRTSAGAHQRSTAKGVLRDDGHHK